MDVVIFGEATERTLKLLADKVRDDLLALDDITYATIGGTRPFEISIEVSERDLQAYGLTLGQVTQRRAGQQPGSARRQREDRRAARSWSAPRASATPARSSGASW